MKYVGVKEVLKAVENNEVKIVYVWDDAEVEVTKKLIELCNEKGIKIKHIETMEELGRLAKIDVKSAAAAE